MPDCLTEDQFDALSGGKLGFSQRRRLLEHVAGCPTCAARLGPPADVLAGRSVGPFVLERELGRGGMGVVYVARQEHPSRTVALKLLHPSAFSPNALRRFAMEVDVLGRLEHPGIARIYAAGVTLFEGIEQPYYAMELIEGASPGVEIVERPLRERLELFLGICDAVGHAHRNGVIHRDIKASNLLIDQHGKPKLIDFGVARATGGGALTRTGEASIVGTLLSMSPEQARGDAVDVRTDVYALGALLCFLLCGEYPIPLAGTTTVAALRKIEEQPPLLPSTRRADLRRHQALDWIVVHCLEKDPEHRYRSVDALADDVLRFLHDRPVAARRSPAVYRAGLFLRRHRRGVIRSCAALVMVGLALGLWHAWQTTAASQAEQTALHADVEDVTGILGRDTEPKTLARLGAERSAISQQLARHDPYGERVREALEAQHAGRFRDAARLWEQAAAIAAANLGDRGAETLDARRQQALMLAKSGYLERSLELAAAALPTVTGGVEHARALTGLATLHLYHATRGYSYAGFDLIPPEDSAEATAMRSALDKARRLIGEALATWQACDPELSQREHVNALMKACEVRLAALHHTTGVGQKELQEELELASGVLTTVEAELGEHSLSAAVATAFVGALEARLGQRDKGIAKLERALADMARMRPLDRIRVAQVQVQLGWAYHARGRPLDAIGVLSPAIEVLEAADPVDEQWLWLARIKYVTSLMGERRFAQAVPVAVDARRFADRRLGAGSVSSLGIARMLVRAHGELREFSEVEREVARARALQLPPLSMAADHVMAIEAVSAQFLDEAGRRAEARELIDRMSADVGTGRRPTLVLTVSLAASLIHQAQGDLVEAKRQARKAVNAATYMAESAALWDARRQLSSVLIDQHDYSEALNLLMSFRDRELRSLGTGARRFLQTSLLWFRLRLGIGDLDALDDLELDWQTAQERFGHGDELVLEMLDALAEGARLAGDTERALGYARTCLERTPPDHLLRVEREQRAAAGR